eukprot:CAMPEP_0113568712 /NCGR_PEP_ID=MMETSP0015_2-20120614/24004_1 /TAXON_ID=2838 /ORGANISM="Odontella" /LENGTH=117 /DNA_ID=CAMNT_0000471289 /DNA_START=165 /DNA_END=516 /DNA_ORIENTATION=+ /assembly_acc=CAM_ASM_000160
MPSVPCSVRRSPPPGKIDEVVRNSASVSSAGFADASAKLRLTKLGASVSVSVEIRHRRYRRVSPIDSDESSGREFERQSDEKEASDPGAPTTSPSRAPIEVCCSPARHSSERSFFLR